ncbi:MAG: hypothetical protein ABH881_00270 [bacterium]
MLILKSESKLKPIVEVLNTTKLLRVVTHKNVDLDNICSTYLLMKVLLPRILAGSDVRTSVLFISPNNYTSSKIPEYMQDIIIDMDIPNSDIKCIKGDADEEGKTHSCFRKLLNEYGTEEDRILFAPLEQFVDLHDAYGGVFRVHSVHPESEQLFHFTSLNAVLRALQTLRPYKDFKTMYEIFRILDGMVKINFGRNCLKDYEDLDLMATRWAQSVFSDKPFAMEFLAEKQMADGESKFAATVKKYCGQEDKEALKHLVGVINALYCGHGNIFSVYQVGHEVENIISFSHLGMIYNALSATTRENDFLEKKIRDILSGLYRNGLARAAAEVEALNPDVVTWIKNDVALVVGAKRTGTTSNVFRNGARVVIYAGRAAIDFEDGNNYDMGIVASDSSLMSRIRRFPIVKELLLKGRWYFNARSAVCGSRKARANGPSGVDPLELAEAVAKAIEP